MDKNTMKEITELLIDKLKNDILRLQKKVMKANEINDQVTCKDALVEQSQLTNNLITLAETYQRKFS